MNKLELKQIKPGIPQGSVFNPILYLLYSSDIPTTEDIVLATFAGDTTVLAKGTGFEKLQLKIQVHWMELTTWTRKWGITIRKTESTHCICRGGQIPKKW